MRHAVTALSAQQNEPIILIGHPLLGLGGSEETRNLILKREKPGVAKPEGKSIQYYRRRQWRQAATKSFSKQYLKYEGVKMKEPAIGDN